MRIELPKALVVLLTLVAVTWLLEWSWRVVTVLYDIILLFFLAWLLGFIMQPLIGWLSSALGGRFHIPRAVAVGLVYLTIFIVLLGGLLILIPLGVQQMVQLGRQAPSWLTTLPARVDDLEEMLARLNINVDLNEAYTRLNLTSTVQSLATMATGEAVRWVTSIATTLGKAVLVIVISFYMVLDLPRIERRWLLLMPSAWSEEVSYFGDIVNRTFGGFIRSQALLALFTGIGTLIVMELAGLPYAVAVGLGAGFIMLVPYLGSFTAHAVPTLIAWQHSPAQALWVLATLFVMHQVMTRLIMPRIVSQQTGLPPVLVLFGMLVGVRIAGIWGALFGAPVVGILYTMAVYLYERFGPRSTRRLEDERERLPTLPPF